MRIVTSEGLALSVGMLVENGLGALDSPSPSVVSIRVHTVPVVS